MHFNATSIILGVCLAVAIVSPVQAATLTPNGVVLVNRGSGFVRINGPVICSPTDRVMVNEGSAHVEYRNGAKIGLHPGRLYTVGDSDDLHARDHHAAHGWQGSHGAQTAAGGISGTAGASSGAAGAAGAAGATAGISGIAATAALVVGAAIAANGIAAIADKVSKPSSP